MSPGPKMFTLLVCAVGSVWSGGVAGKPPPYRGKGHRNCPIKEHPIKEQRDLQMRERAITEYIAKAGKVEEIAKRAGVTGSVFLLHPLLDCRVNSSGPTDLCVCAERTLYTWVAIWRKTGSFKPGHRNCTMNRYSVPVISVLETMHDCYLP